jgi:Cu+-exporting ATPase
MSNLTLKLGGMSCAACANTIEKSISNVPGVSRVNVNFAMERSQVEYDAQKTDAIAIQAAVSDAGYQAYVINDSKHLQDRKRLRSPKHLLKKGASRRMPKPGLMPNKPKLLAA